MVGATGLTSRLSIKPRQANCRHPTRNMMVVMFPAVLRPFWFTQTCHRSYITPRLRLFIRVRSVESLTWNTAVDLSYRFIAWLVNFALLSLFPR